jgi:hypothetical protein
MHKRFALVLAFALAAVAVIASPLRAQDGAALIEMTVDAGYDAYFRDDQWLPVQVNVTNNGDPIDARVIVRPQTTRGVGGTYSVPMELPTNSSKRDQLYITARGTVTQLRVELLSNESDVVLASRQVPLVAIQPTEQLYVVITQAAAGSIDMTNARGMGMVAYQANWSLDDIPTNAAALESVNALVFTDVDTGGLTLDQERALESWVADGGHLIVTGGPNWQATAEGLRALLPLNPGDSENLPGLQPLADYLGIDADLTADTSVAVGELVEGARVLVASDEAIPLLVRRELGDGTVDYLTPDPNVAPLRGWQHTSALWYNLVITRTPVPNWSQDFRAWDAAKTAAEILPGLDVLPSVLPLCGFLALYIVLIGPVNYLILNRINRREYAWLTIPALIVLFSGLAWVVGSELRGNDPSIGRLTLVRSWPNTEVARTTELIGLLSPQRTQYTLDVADNTFLRTIPNTELVGTNSLLESTFETSIEIQQFNGFRAFEFPVDASFVAGFAANSTTEKPQISGSVLISYPDDDRNVQMIRGSVTNNTDQTLEDGVILARGVAYRLQEPIEPGDVQAFPLLSANRITLEGSEMAAPSPIGYDGSRVNLGFGYNSGGYYEDTVDRTLTDIMGQNGNFGGYYSGNDARTPEERTAQEEMRRRWSFLTALLRDPYFSTGRGDKVYFVGWSNRAVTDVDLAERTYNAYDSTLYVVELESEIQRPVATRVRVASDQFVWSVFEKNTLSNAAPVNLRLSEGNSIAFRYTPIETARLEVVDELHLLVRYNSGGAPSMPLQLWDWQDQAWDDVTITNNQLILRRPDEYIGPQNAVVVRVVGTGVYYDIQSIRVEQLGEFAEAQPS